MSQQDKLAIIQSKYSFVATTDSGITGISNTEKEKYHDAIAHFLDKSLLKCGFNGSILIAKNGSIVYEKYVGYKDIGTKDVLTAETPLQIASTSKTFTAIAILKLVQEGKLKLTDSLTALFPQFPYAGITVKMLLNHRSGLPNYMYFIAPKLNKHVFLTNTDVLNSLINIKPPRAFAPNAHFQYNNTNYVLLALIIEKITGLSYPVYMKSNIFEPLQMHHTFVHTVGDSMHITPSYSANGDLWQLDHTDGPYGDKNIYSTPRDLLKWDQALYTYVLVNKNLMDSAYTPYSKDCPAQRNYGLGWRLLTLPGGKRMVYHHGRWHGFNAAFARLVDEKATIIILGNKYKNSIYSTARNMYNLFGNYGNAGIQVIGEGGAEEKE